MTLPGKYFNACKQAEQAIRQWLVLLLLALMSVAANAQSDAASNSRNLVDTLSTAVGDAATVITALLEEPKPRNYTQPREPCTDFDASRQPYFGDLHVHTKYSLDANTQSTLTTPDQAYRFAKGERLGIQPWRDGEPLRSLQLDRPLDFAMISDHAELFGETYICNNPGADGYKSWQCKIYRHLPRVAFYLFNANAALRQSHLGFCGDDGIKCKEAASLPWQEMQRAADDHNDATASCEFTALIGYEWTGVTEGAGNLHRNVVFRNHIVPDLPISWIEGSALHLWQSLDEQCNESGSGCEALTIPHNSNISSGAMFDLSSDGKQPMTPEQYSLRKKYEPIVEMFQHKGASECYYAPGIVKDELCAFEFLNNNSFFGNAMPAPGDGYLRDVLKDGLLAERDSGINPFEYGFIGSSDTHLGAPGAVSERIYHGHGGAGAPASKKVPPGLPDLLKYNPGGLAVVWAEENSRDALFEGMQRRETYATSGPRIITRFFGGWDYPQTMCDSRVFAQRGYQSGVPMGGILPEHQAKEGDAIAPVFAVSAMQDAGTANTPGTPLQKVQIIKGWIDEQGEKHEQVYDIAGDSTDAASVDINTCETTGPGHANLCTVWSDPDFDASQPAYYYSRVVENPTCRWSQRMCVDRKVDCSDKSTITKGMEGCCAPEHRPVIRERAWSSPIWYKPQT